MHASRYAGPFVDLCAAEDLGLGSEGGRFADCGAKRKALVHAAVLCDPGAAHQLFSAVLLGAWHVFPWSAGKYPEIAICGCLRSSASSGMVA